jgi:hypothetical protein
MKHFKNPVSMVIPSQEAFERDLRKPLEELGAKFEAITSFSKHRILISNYNGIDGTISNVSLCNKKEFNRHFIETYDPEQFLAICKLEVEMAVGECYTVVVADTDSKMVGFLLENNVNNNGSDLFGLFKGVGFIGYYFSKATVKYSGTDLIVRLSTPEEKENLYKVIAEEEGMTTDQSLEEKIHSFKEEIEEFVSSHKETVLKINSAIREHKEEIKKLKYALKIIKMLK